MAWPPLHGMIEPVALVVFVYIVSQAMVVMTTLLDYLEARGSVGFREFLLALREVSAVALEALWLLFILHAWGILNLSGLVAAPSLPLEGLDMLRLLAALSLVILAAVLYYGGRVVDMLIALVVASLIYPSAVQENLLTLAWLVALGLVVLAVGYWAVASQQREPLA